MIDHGILFIVFACVFGLMMTWGIGANDLANVMSTAIGSKAINVKQAIIIAVLFEFAGAFLGGGEVIQTLRSNIINTHLLDGSPTILIEGMLSVLLAGTIWIIAASAIGVPVSITNAIVGALIGFGAVVLGPKAVHWQQVSYIAISWFSSPFIAGLTAFALFNTVQNTILGAVNPIESAKRYLPIYLFLVGLVLSAMTLLKGLSHFHLLHSAKQAITIVIGCGLLVVVAGMKIIKRRLEKVSDEKNDKFHTIEKMFAVLMALTACAMVFAHGSNDVAIAVGPMTAVIHLAMNQSMAGDGMPYWIVFLGCSGVVLGLLMYGRKVIETVGSGITALTPSRGFVATLAAASTVVFSTSLGIPVSATQTLVGAILGVGLARGIGALNLSVIRNIFMSWVITLPAASLLTIGIYYAFKASF